MNQLLHELVTRQNKITPQAFALGFKDITYTYHDVVENIWQVANGLINQGLSRHERVAIYLPKLPETVFSLMGISAAGGVFVPINPILKADQVSYILQDCNVRVLVTNAARLRQLAPELSKCHDLRQIILIDELTTTVNLSLPIIQWQALLDSVSQPVKVATIDIDMAAILYTSGSTGRPKGVVLSHRNMVTGAYSVAEYLENNQQDKILAVLPFSFDYGLSQLTTAFSVGACCYLMDYLLPRDVIKAVHKYKITGLAAVPPLWVQLADLTWPEETSKHLRYITNSGGAMPTATLGKLQNQLPNTSPFLMYGLTEAFRSSYLPPSELEKRPSSMGKAIPNAELLVINDTGEICGPNEPGELVHRGSLVALGYWNDQERTQERFKPVPNPTGGLPIMELAVWSGDLVKKDEEGFLYFIGRNDDMIKTSGYRVSPTEVEEVVYASGLVGEVAALGIPHIQLGQAIVLAVTTQVGRTIDATAIINLCKQKLPNFMIPQKVINYDALPKNPNGKIDRKALANNLSDLFE